MLPSEEHRFQIEIVSGISSELLAAEYARGLCEELDSIRRGSARIADGAKLPAGAKAVGMGLAETIIAVSAAGALLPTLVNAIRDWLVRQPQGTTIRIKDGEFELEWSGATLPDSVSSLVTHLARQQKT